MSMEAQATSIEATAAVRCRDRIVISLPATSGCIKEFSAVLIIALKTACLDQFSSLLVKNLERINTGTREPELEISWCNACGEITEDDVDDLERVVLQVGGRLDSTRGHSGYHD